jgi:hypothetical protein
MVFLFCIVINQIKGIIISQYHIWSRRRIIVGVVTLESHIIEDLVDVGEEVVVRKVSPFSLGIRVEEASSHAVALAKNLIALLPWKTRKDKVYKAYCPTHAARWWHRCGVSKRATMEDKRV